MLPDPALALHPTIVLQAETAFTLSLAELTGPKSSNYTTFIRRRWQPTPLTAPRKRLHHTHPRPAAFTIYTAQDYSPGVWRNSPAGISLPASPQQLSANTFVFLREPLLTSGNSGAVAKTGTLAYSARRRRSSAEIAGTT